MSSQISFFSRVMVMSLATTLLACGNAAQCPPRDASQGNDPQGAQTSDDQTRRLTLQRDSANTRAEDIEQREKIVVGFQQRRNALEQETWQKLDVLDPQMADVKARLVKWVSPNPKATLEVMTHAEAKRGRIERDLRRIQTESEASFGALKAEIEADLEDLSGLLQSPAVQH